jgi:hypothetical protein
MTTNIEPTEEQMQAAIEWISLPATVRHSATHIARLLAEREHKLREENSHLRRQNDDLRRDQDRVGADVAPLRRDLDAARARIAELEERSARRLDDSTAIDALVYAVACLELQPGIERDRDVRDAMARVITHVGAIEVRAKDSATKLVSTLVAGAKAREEALTKRVAELEADALRFAAVSSDGFIATKSGPVHVDDVASVLEAHEEREAAHLAHIKAGRKAVAAWINDPWIEGRHKMGVQFLADTAHCDVEGEKPAVAVVTTSTPAPAWCVSPGPSVPDVVRSRFGPCCDVSRCASSASPCPCRCHDVEGGEG